MVDTMAIDKDMKFTNTLKLLETLICTMETTQQYMVCTHRSNSMSAAVPQQPLLQSFRHNNYSSWPPTKGDSKGNGRWDGVKKMTSDKLRLIMLLFKHTQFILCTYVHDENRGRLIHKEIAGKMVAKKYVQQVVEE
ncbi:hypothetical protein Tco_1297081 [Tanacetum coccineum]